MRPMGALKKGDVSETATHGMVRVPLVSRHPPRLEAMVLPLSDGVAALLNADQLAGDRLSGAGWRGGEMGGSLEHRGSDAA